MKMRLFEARIGYAGYSRDFSAPGDRRRFVAYAEQRGLQIEYPCPSRAYDLVYLTCNADIPGWIARKRRAGNRLKLVFELVDSYFAQDNWFYRHLKGVGRFAEGRDSRLRPDFLKTLKAVCGLADAVVCSTIEQQATISQYNPNTFVSFDYFLGELGPPKTDFSRSDRLKLVWEGQAVTMPGIQTIREPLNQLRHKVELHVVSDLSVNRYFGRFGELCSEEMLRGIECPIIVHPWRKASFANQIVDCDVALIPMDLSQRMVSGKPENKLILLWQLGMPVLVSPTLAYRRAMAGADLDMICATPDDWLARLKMLSDASPPLLQQIAAQGRDYALSRYSASNFRAPFDVALTAIGFDGAGD